MNFSIAAPENAWCWITAAMLVTADGLTVGECACAYHKHRRSLSALAPAVYRGHAPPEPARHAAPALTQTGRTDPLAGASAILSCPEGFPHRLDLSQTAHRGWDR